MSFLLCYCSGLLCTVTCKGHPWQLVLASGLFRSDDPCLSVQERRASLNPRKGQARSPEAEYTPQNQSQGREATLSTEVEGNSLQRALRVSIALSDHQPDLGQDFKAGIYSAAPS